jgi:hypothetical protein
MANTALKKITIRAKAIRRAAPGKSWKSAIKQAGSEYRTGKISGVKKRRSPAKRKKVGAKYKVYHEVKRVGSVKSKGRGFTVGSINQHKAAARHQVKERLAWMLLARDSAKTKTERKKLGKKVMELRKEYRNLE